ncbi:MAG: ATP-binding cassette domain-containing protein [Pedobacter sp.]|nr:MAG: ATP-binding cassette domain-containing protein [Pedobacter sp.]
MEKKKATSDLEKVIEIKGLYKSFGNYHVLKGVDLDLYNRENLVVLGKSGTGKSVLIKIVVGLLTPDSGEVKVLKNSAVEEMLDAVGLLSTINQMPSELSGGQRKRIGIARTLILRPEIMLYDEPTAGLDPITCLEINSLINEVQERFNTSSIIITHDLTCAKAVGNRVAMLLDGKFERQGTFEEVFNTNDERVKPFYDYNFIQ